MYSIMDIIKLNRNQCVTNIAKYNIFDRKLPPLALGIANFIILTREMENVVISVSLQLLDSVRLLSSKPPDVCQANYRT